MGYSVATQPKSATTGPLIPENLQPEQRLNFHAVSALVGMGRTKVYSLIKEGKFPAPERYGKRCSRWRAGTIVGHMNDQAGNAA